MKYFEVKSEIVLPAYFIIKCKDETTEKEVEGISKKIISENKYFFNKPEKEIYSKTSNSIEAIGKEEVFASDDVFYISNGTYRNERNKKTEDSETEIEKLKEDKAELLESLNENIYRLLDMYISYDLYGDKHKGIIRDAESLIKRMESEDGTH